MELLSGRMSASVLVTVGPLGQHILSCEHTQGCNPFHTRWTTEEKTINNQIPSYNFHRARVARLVVRTSGVIARSSSSMPVERLSIPPGPAAALVAMVARSLLLQGDSFVRAERSQSFHITNQLSDAERCAVPDACP